MNLIPTYCSSPLPPPLFRMPMRRRNLTGSAQRRRNVVSDSETAWCPFCGAFGTWSPREFLSHAIVSNWRARMRARIPVLVAEQASGSKPTGVVPKRTAASVEREQHMLRHCLRIAERKLTHIIKSFTLHYSQACKFIEQGTTLIWLIISHLHVLWIQRATASDSILTELNSS